MTFEEKFAKLTQIVQALEDSSELPLEESLKLYEEGVGLVRACREVLEKAELRIENVAETDTP